jgi:hypothetical protein
LKPRGTRVKIKPTEKQGYITKPIPSKIGEVIEVGELAKEVKLGMCVFVPDANEKINEHYYTDKQYVFSAL